QVIDTTSPVVTLNESAEFGGTDLVTFKAGQTFVDPGVTSDDLDSATEMVVTHKISPDAWFTFDDEVNPGMDVTENGWDGQFYNMAARSDEGRYGAGLLISSLDSNSRFEIPGNGFPLKSEWTATAWFKKLYPTGRWRTLFRGRNTDHQIMFSNNSDLLGNYANGRGDFRSSGFSLTSDESKAWRHITAVGIGNETRFYMDGQFVGASDQKGIDSIFLIGNQANQHFAKYIDDVMLFNRALSEQEIAIAKGGNQPFDTTNPGAYSLLYTVTDSSGNTSQAFRKVVVEEDVSAPVITLIGKTEVTHEAGEEYQDNGAFVSTADGEPLLNEGLKTETDLASLPGTYSFTYTFTDEKGSVAIPVMRSIKVIDTSGPVITLVGASPITLPRGEVYDDPGALAEDNVDGIVPVQVVGMTQPYVALDIGPLAQRVQDGWIGVSGGNNDQNNIILPSQEVVTPDGHTLTIQISSVDWRDRGDSTSSAPLARVAEDFVKNNAGDITLTLTGLPEGDYVFTTYHLDVLNAQSEQINVYVTDANGQDVLQGVQGNANLNPGVNNITEGNFGNTSATFKIKSDGVDPIEVRLDGQVPDTEVPINALVIETPVVISAVGEYLLTYSAMDSLGHRSEITRTVIVSDDATIPSITLLGDKEINLEAGNAFGDPGITLKDRDGNDLDASLVQVSGKVLSDVPGIYVLAYDYADADGKVAVTRKRTITVGDSIAPAITLNGAATIVHILGEPYQDAGATAVDTVSGVVEVTDSFNFYSNGLIAHWNFEDLTDDIARDQVSGQHGVMKRFDLVTDHIDGIRGKALNFDGVDNRIDVPVLGRNPSEFTVSAWLLRRNGNASSIFHTKGWEAGDLHFIVQNDINFAFNGMGQQSGGGGNDFRSIDQLKLNEWTHVAVAYSLNAKQAQIYIDGELLRETTFTGTRRIMLKDGLFIGAGQNGTDRFLDGALDEVAIYDRALTSSQVRAVMDGGQTVDVRTEGQYAINFTAHDASGNKAMATRTVIVTADPDAPVITLLGNAEIAHEAGNPFEDPGATVSDKDGNALEAASIVVGGEVKSDTLGQYTLTYDFTDDAGGKAMQILRKVTIADTLAPVITLIGDKETRIGINAPFTDPGATAKDLFEGDIQVQANIPIPIDTNAAGDYEIIYTATDSVGNKAEIKRTVKVLPDTTPPVITLVGESTMTINLGSEYDEDGAIAEDNIDGILTPFLEDSGTVDAVDTSKEGTYIITYDVSDSAGNKALQVTRTVIVKSADPFDNWLDKVAADQRTPQSDPDNDGIPNLLEYAFGGDPAIADRAIVLPEFDPSDGSLKLTFIHLKASIDPKLNYMPEITSSLKAVWSTDGLTTKGALQGVPQDNLPDGKPFATSDYARASVTADAAMVDAGSKQFLRISVIRE
ncbi:MAG: DUF5011 domain-containing protein, partial [Opitutae bacterium]|nr:DUF5011 domain-containing protein [Opitutae bacterium]